MEKFKISDIQEIFVADVERFHTLTQNHVTQLLNEATPTQEALDDALRQCHTLKGLAATVEAWGLACLGADLEKLLELAGSWMHNEREKANSIFEFILDHMQDWYVMNQFTCMDMLPQAWDMYLGLRGTMDERWPDYLPPPQSADGASARFVRLADLELAEIDTASDAAQPAATLELPTPELDVQGVEPVASTAEPAPASTQAAPGAPTPLRVVPPALRSRNKVSSADSNPPTPLPIAIDGRDVKQDAPIAAVGPSLPQLSTENSQPASGAPTPLKVKPPTLRSRDQSKAPAPALPQLSIGDSQPPVVASEPAATPGQPAVPKPLQVVPPSLRRKDVAEPALPQLSTGDSQPPALAPVQQVEAAVPATPPLLRVAPPALKRRAKKVEPTVVEAVETPTPVLEQPTVTPLAVEPAAILAASIEPLAVEASTPAPAPVEPAAVEPLVAESTITSLPAAPQTPEPISQTPEPSPDATAEFLSMLSEEVAGYLTDLSVNLNALAADLSDVAQWEQTRRLFHTIKGTAATFQLDAISAPAKAAEARCVEAVENTNARTREAFELCVDRAGVVARALKLVFDEQPLRVALEAGLAQAANVAMVSAAPVVVALDPEMAGFFISDARDQIGIIEQAVLRWEKLGAGVQSAESTTRMLECVNAAQRGFHTIKGAGNSIGLSAVAQSVHEVEAFLEGAATTLSQLSTGNSQLPLKPLFTFLLGAVDQLRQYLADLTRNTASPWRHDWSAALRSLGQPAEAKTEARKSERAIDVPVAATLPADADDDSHTLRIEAARLYQLMNLIGEMVVDRSRLARKIDQLTVLHRALAERNGALTESVQSFQQQFEFNLMQAKGQSPQSKGQSPESTVGARDSGLGTPDSGLKSHGEFSELEFDRYDQFNVLARSLVEISHDIEQLNGEVEVCLEAFAAENAQFSQTSQQLQSKVTSLSLVPVKTLFPRLQRAFRDALTVEEKQADLVLQGGEAMLDKVVVDKVYGPLLHLVRNAVAHGVENSKARETLKKPARGQVRMSATQLANQIVIQLTDDGAGINGEAVRKRAVEKGWLAADAPALTPEQVVHFIFQPGFSTASKVTSVSGRGVGLDVVRTEIENLNGSVELRYEPGQGSTWTLRLPLTLAISEAILAKLGEVTYAFPLNFIEYGVVLDADTLVRGEDGSETYVIQAAAVPQAETADAATAKLLDPNSDTSHFARDSVTGASVPVLRLSRVLGVPGDLTSNKGLIVGAGERRAVLVVDAVLARQEIVIKQLDSVLAQHPLLNGATLDAEGRVIPILNLPTLLKFGEQTVTSEYRAPARPESAKRLDQLRVLIVDDSLSVRKVQERHLSDLGCKVTTASDGLYALEKMREQEFDFIFTDLEMPRLNGYELISELQGNPAWSSIPIVVVSSRGADKYITKAMNLGAATFLSKPFTQQQLQQVLGHYSKAANASRSGAGSAIKQVA